jgi:DNA-binding transcriptional MerR regulator
MKRTERPFSAKEVSAILGIGDSTLRKWCLAIEEQGYYFPRTDNNKRLFFKQHVDLLKTFRKFVQVQNMSMENAATLIISKVEEEPFEQENTDNTVPSVRSDNEIIQKLLNHIEQQEQFNKELLKRLEEHQKYIEERLNQRDAALIQSLREVQETKKLLVAAEEKRQEEKKKGIWQRIFGG